MSALKSRIRLLVGPFFSLIELTLVSDYPFPAEKSNLRLGERITLLWELVRPRLLGRSRNKNYEVSAVIYSEPGKRMLIPVVTQLARRPDVKQGNVRVNVILKKTMLSAEVLDQVRAAGCGIAMNTFNLMKACAQPEGKVVLLCLDHRYFYEYHRFGVDVADILRKYGVKTISIQHGGTREDSVRGLASAASDVVLVWGKRTLRELVREYQVDQRKFRLVGNPLHDRLLSLDRESIIEEITKRYPSFRDQILKKKLVLLATCLHGEYKEFKDEQEKYMEYVRHVYNSLDFSQILLIVKMHPGDKTDPNLYQQLIPTHLSESILIVEPGVAGVDVYSLLHISDLLITRASTVAEEALLLGKKVIAFDVIESGPSKYYKHLEEYENYLTVYASPKTALKDAVSGTLFLSSDGRRGHDAIIEEEIAYSLDGGSTDRAVNEILAELFK